MVLSAAESGFLETRHSAAMITIGGSGIPKAVRVGVALVDGRLWGSGTQDRVRTRRLRRDPRCTLFVFDPGFSWLTLETTVTILDGPDAAALNLTLFRVMQNRPSGPLSWFGGELDEASFLRTLTGEGRLIYDFEVDRGYGLT
ncbi:MAG TPA: pyridoxamine 5'-phosphate oxidase family protein [Streptosporangiaceae bacterium]|nr:pyridoxamine 5'-phosphate oxidase family protein [Streptosporangiaceae bacterium]